MTINEKLADMQAETIRNKEHVKKWKEEKAMYAQAEKLGIVNIIDDALKWRDARAEKPKEPRDYIVFVGYTDRRGVKRGFQTYGHWTGRAWNIFNLLDQDEIPRITHWIEWFPKLPDGYVQEE